MRDVFCRSLAELRVVHPQLVLEVCQLASQYPFLYFGDEGKRFSEGSKRYFFGSLNVVLTHTLPHDLSRFHLDTDV